MKEKEIIEELLKELKKTLKWYNSSIYLGAHDDGKQCVVLNFYGNKAVKGADAYCSNYAKLYTFNNYYEN